jgi:hypothetical protein
MDWNNYEEFMDHAPTSVVKNEFLRVVKLIISLKK